MAAGKYTTGNKASDALIALRAFAEAYWSLQLDADEALQVGGYVPTEDDATTEISVRLLCLAAEVFDESDALAYWATQKGPR